MVRVRIQNWGVLRQRLGWSELDLELREGATVGDALKIVPGLPPGAARTGNDGDTLYQIMTRGDSVRVDKWLCVNGHIRADRKDVLALVLNDGDHLLVMDATLASGG